MFFKNELNTKPSDGFGSTNENLMRYATYASMCVATLLITTKFAAWVMTGSVSLLSTLIDSFLDAAASLINLIAVRHALNPADKEHRFGHGKAEALAGVGQSAFILGSAMFLLIEAGERILNLKPIENAPVGYVVMIFSIFLTLLLVVFQRYVIKRSNSVAITADSLHYQTDILVNLGVMLSLYLAAQLGWYWSDPIFATGIAIFIIYSAWKIGLRAVEILMDRELPDSERKKISEIVLAEEGVTGLHDLRTRSSGTQVFIQLHLQLDGDMKLRDAHEIADRVEFKVAAAFDKAEVIVHQDPEGIEENHPTLS